MPAKPAAWQNTPRHADETPLARRALGVVDASLAGTIFAVPLALGGRHDLGRFLFIALAAAAAVGWCVRQSAVANKSWSGSAAYAVPLLAVLLLAVQCTPLPPQMAGYFEESVSQLLPLWSTEAAPSFGSWKTISLAPAETKLALANLIAYGLLFFAAHQRARKVEDVGRLIKWLALSVVASAAFAFVHTVASNGLHFWVYDVPYASPERGFCGGFTNRNHFAHFLVLGVGPLAAWLVLRDRDDQKRRQEHRRSRRRNSPTVSRATLFGCVALGLVVLMVFLTASRGGALALLASSAVLLAVFRAKSLITTRHFAAIGVLGTVLLAVVSLYGFDRVAERLETLLTGDLEEVDSRSGRRTVWQANLAAFQQRPAAGTGAGSHRDAHAVFVPEHTGVVFTHAENGYLQILSENGTPGALLMLAGVGFCISWCAVALLRSESAESSAYAAAATAGLAASLTHSVVDFVWYIPGCMGPTLVLAACQLRLSQMAPQRRERLWTSLTPVTGWATTASLVVAAAWSVAAYYGPAVASVYWDRYSRIAIADRELLGNELLRTRPREESHALRVANAEAMIQSLRDVLSYRPDNARAHRALASRYLQLFDLRQQDSQNALSAAQLRETVEACGFADQQQLNGWLSKAVGKNLSLLATARRHALLSLQYCPIAAAPYINLADTGFLTGQPPQVTDTLLEQAIRVRPKSPRVLYTVGAYKLNSGKTARGEELWKLSYQTPGSHRLQIIRTLAYQTSATYFIETFSPDWDSLEDVWRFFQESQPQEELTRLVDYADEAAQNEPPLERRELEGRKWVTLSEMHSAAERPDRAIRALVEGYRREPTVWVVRRALGLHLAESQRHKEAEPHLRWCLGRRPHDQIVQQALVTAAKQRLAAMRNDDTAWK